MAELRERSWGIDRRLEFLEYRVFWEGRVNRSDLQHFFRISTPQASTDFARYRDVAPNNLVYDSTERAFVAGERFDPVFYRPSADRYLAQLRALAEHVVDRSEVPVGEPPCFDVVPTVHRRLDSEIVRGIVAAARERVAICAVYQSFSSPEPRARWLSPHAFASDGHRWHFRAWCHTRQDFRDFALGRVLEIVELRPSEIDPAEDLAWSRTVEFVLAPHPGLSPGMRRAIEHDYAMTEGRVAVTVREALAYYMWKQLGLDRIPEDTPAHQYHVILVNRSEVEAVVNGAGGAPA